MAALYPQSLPVYRPARPVSKRFAGPPEAVRWAIGAAGNQAGDLKEWPFPGPRCSKTDMTEPYPIRPNFR